MMKVVVAMFVLLAGEQVFGKTVRRAERVCRTVESTQDGGSEADIECQFPFTYNGILYTACVEEGVPWCAVVGGQGMWGYCADDCPEILAASDGADTETKALATDAQNGDGEKGMDGAVQVTLGVCLGAVVVLVAVGVAANKYRIILKARKEGGGQWSDDDDAKDRSINRSPKGRKESMIEEKKHSKTPSDFIDEGRLGTRSNASKSQGQGSFGSDPSPLKDGKATTNEGETALAKLIEDNDDSNMWADLAEKDDTLKPQLTTKPPVYPEATSTLKAGEWAASTSFSDGKESPSSDNNATENQSQRQASTKSAKSTKSIKSTKSTKSTKSRQASTKSGVVAAIVDDPVDGGDHEENSSGENDDDNDDNDSIYDLAKRKPSLGDDLERGRSPKSEYANNKTPIYDVANTEVDPVDHAEVTAIDPEEEHVYAMSTRGTSPQEEEHIYAMSTRGTSPQEDDQVDVAVEEKASPVPSPTPPVQVESNDVDEPLVEPPAPAPTTANPEEDSKRQSAHNIAAEFKQKQSMKVKPTTTQPKDQKGDNKTETAPVIEEEEEQKEEEVVVVEEQQQQEEVVEQQEQHEEEEAVVVVEEQEQEQEQENSGVEEKVAEPPKKKEKTPVQKTQHSPTTNSNTNSSKSDSQPPIASYSSEPNLKKQQMVQDKIKAAQTIGNASNASPIRNEFDRMRAIPKVGLINQQARGANVGQPTKVGTDSRFIATEVEAQGQVNMYRRVNEQARGPNAGLKTGVDSQATHITHDKNAQHLASEANLAKSMGPTEKTAINNESRNIAGPKHSQNLASQVNQVNTNMRGEAVGDKTGFDHSSKEMGKYMQNQGEINEHRRVNEQFRGENVGQKTGFGASREDVAMSKMQSNQEMYSKQFRVQGPRGEFSGQKTGFDVNSTEMSNYKKHQENTNNQLRVNLQITGDVSRDKIADVKYHEGQEKDHGQLEPWKNRITDSTKSRFRRMMSPEKK